MTEPTTRVPRGHEPPPVWYGWTIKLIMATALALFGVSFILLLIFVAPTAKSNADAVKNLAAADAFEKRQDACFDLYSSRVSDGNAAVLASLTVSTGLIADLVVALAAPSPDQSVVGAVIDRLGRAATGNAQASATYDAALAARAKWVAGGRHIPCPLR